MITGEGLVLRAPRHDDAERWFALYQDPDELAYGVPVGVPVPASPEDVGTSVDSALERLAAGEPATFVIATEDDPDRFLGTIGWRLDVPALLRVADIGYGVHPDARRQGVASRAVVLVARWLTTADDGPHMARVQLDHSTENLASCRTALRAGFDQEGVRRSFLPLRDGSRPDGVRRHDVCLHGYVPD